MMICYIHPPYRCYINHTIYLRIHRCVQINEHALPKRQKNKVMNCQYGTVSVYGQNGTSACLRLGRNALYHITFLDTL